MTCRFGARRNESLFRPWAKYEMEKKSKRVGFVSDVVWEEAKITRFSLALTEWHIQKWIDQSTLLSTTIFKLMCFFLSDTVIVSKDTGVDDREVT